MHALLLPLVDQGRNKITTRFVSNDKSFLQTASHTQRRGTELIDGPCFVIVSHVNLTKVLHVMHIQPHHVSQSVRHKQSMRTGFYCILHISFHQSQLLQSLRQHFAYFQVDILVSHSRFRNFYRLIVSCQYDIIYIFLPVRKLSADGYGPGEIGTIGRNRFGTGIRQHQTPFLQNLAMIVVV